MSDNGERRAIYDKVIGAAFLSLRQKFGNLEYYDYDKALLEGLIDSLARQKVIPKRVKNIPDIKYTYDAREDFPPQIATTGNWAIVGRGKSRYRFVRIPQRNLIRVPQDLPSKPDPLVVSDSTPQILLSVLGDDEQAMLARIEHNGILDRFTRLRITRIQEHERTTISAGQIEVDSVSLGETTSGERFVIPVSAKGGGKDCLSYTQALNLNMYAVEKHNYPGLGLRPLPLGITRGADGSIYILRFSVTTRIEKIRIEQVGRFSLQRE